MIKGENAGLEWQVMESYRPAYPIFHTALLLVDPYNDVLSEGGKIWPQLAEVAGAVDLHANLRRLSEAIRCAKWPIYFVPHRRAEPNELDHWHNPTPSQQVASQASVFGRGSWGGDWYAALSPQPQDTVVREHWGANGFAGTDLDLLLRQRNISHLIVIGLIANTCIEATSRCASELGYHVTLVRDATAAFSQEAMRCAHEINGPTYAHEILTTREVLARVPFIAEA